MVSFLHTADLHLGLRVTRFSKQTNSRVQEARFQALDNIVAEARKRQVDFLLIAGDLFDDNHVEATVARRAAKVLQALSIPVYVLPGNHDPLTADSVWERVPWNELAGSQVHVLRTAEPVSLPGEVVLYPCPLTRKTGLDDPTTWIPPRPPGDRLIRIGVAHGSLKDRDNLSPDDHLIERHAADDHGLDYLALGHWHKVAHYSDRAGVVRTAYTGMHEPKGFQGSSDFSIGWVPYTHTTSTDLFEDNGHGRVLAVTIDGPGAAPALEEIDVGCLVWIEETREIPDEDALSRLIDELAHRPNPERQLLRLNLQGRLSAKARLRLDELDEAVSGGQGGVLSRYCWGELNADRLYDAEPSEDELKDLAGDGVLRHVYTRLRQEADSQDESTRQLARESLLVLYRVAQEVKR